ncbi:MAG: CAP domain-containing protein [Oscillospiraceae bacterium]|jgi:uncharacterized protein YkwD|nr:CAP domain-containing protein [Oscillospiraceae bacterium]
MLTSQKVFYIIILSMMFVCNFTGINYQDVANVYGGGDDSLFINSELSLDPDSEEGEGELGLPEEGSSISNIETIVPADGRIEVNGGNSQNPAVTPDDNVITNDVPANPDEPTTEPTIGGDIIGNDPGETTTTTTTTTAAAPIGGQETQPNQPAQPIPTLPPQTQPAQPNQPAQPTQPQQQETQPTTQKTTTTTTRPTAAPVQNYSNVGDISFSSVKNGATVTDMRVYLGETAALYLNVPIGASNIAVYSSMDSSIASTNSGSGSVTVRGNALGTTWVKATNANRDECYCRITVVDYATQVIYLVNEQRAAAGLPPMTQGGAELQNVANLRMTESMSLFSHTRPNGQKFSSAFLQCGITSGKMGENLARGQKTPEIVIREWMASPTHKANILSTEFTQICVAYGVKPADNLAYWAQSFYRELG